MHRLWITTQQAGPAPAPCHFCRRRRCRRRRCLPPLPAAAACHRRPALLRSLGSLALLQHVESYEYEMPSDFEDEDIDDEMAFTGGLLHACCQVAWCSCLMCGLCAAASRLRRCCIHADCSAVGSPQRRTRRCLGTCLMMSRRRAAAAAAPRMKAPC